MTSRTHRGIGIEFIPLLAIACLLVLQAAPTSSASRTKKTSDNKSTGVSDYSKYPQEHLKNLADSAKCPFKLLVNNGFTEVVCDRSNCTRGSWCYQECKQAYLYANEIIPKKACNKKWRTRAKIRAGCIYTPKHQTRTIQTQNPDK
jgi:hypothetical protein